MRYSFVLLIFFVLAECIPDKEAHTFSNLGRIVVDSAAKGKEYLTFDQRHSEAYYPVYYIGKQTDTLFLGHQPISMFSNEELEKRYDTATNWNSAMDMEIGVFVDTTMNVGHEIIYSHFSKDIDKDILDSTTSIKAFTLFITNQSDSLVWMGSHNFVGHLTREVQDQDGKWIEVEHLVTGLCGTAKRSLILEHGDIMVAKVLRYKADTKLSCRLKLSMKFGNIEAYRTYSNVFEDYFDMTRALEKKSTKSDAVD